MENAERLQKIISAAGIASRRKAELLIEQGRVTVNGSIVTTLGTKADPQSDYIKVDGKLIRGAPRKVYVLLNKPRQVISSVSDPQGRTSVTDLVDVKGKLYPVGRLDYDTEGLILLTNDGEFARVVGSAGEFFPKVYHVKIQAVPDEIALDRLRAGIRLKDGTRLSRCKIVSLRTGNNPWFEVTLTQGKNRQIRQMFEAIGHRVQKLRRTRIGFISDKGLPPGGYRHLTEREIVRFMSTRRKDQLLRTASKRPGGREHDREKNC
jgi:23S rRNA pseudouridine2605 synthase